MLRLPLQNPNHNWGDPPGADENDPYSLLPEPIADSLKWAVQTGPAVSARERPFTPFLLPLADCRVTLMSDAGLAPAAGFGSRGFLPVALETRQLQTSADSYDTSAINQDNSVALPLACLLELGRAGRIGMPTALHISLPAPPEFQTGRAGRKPTGWADSNERNAAAIVQCLMQQQTNLLVATATLPTGLDRLARYLHAAETAGIATLLVNPWWPATRLLTVSRSGTLFMPPGYPLGDAGWQTARTEILLALLDSVGRMTRPGSVQHLPQRWPWPVGNEHFMTVNSASG